MTGTRSTATCPTPSTWGGTAATKVLAAEVRKHVQCKREADIPLAMAGHAKTTTALLPEKCSEKAAWGAWMPAEAPAPAPAELAMAAGTDAPARPTTIADLRGSQFFPASTDPLAHRTNADDQARRMLVGNTSRSGESRSGRIELSASDQSTNDQSGRSMRAANDSPLGFAPDAGQASRSGTSPAHHVPTGEAPSESMIQKRRHALAQTVLQTDAQPIAAHDVFVPRVLSDASTASSKLSSSAQSTSDASAATGSLSDDSSGRCPLQETIANKTLAPRESAAPAEQGTVSSADIAQPGSALWSATGVRPVREVDRDDQSSAPALDQENSSLQANTTTIPPLESLVTPSTKESAIAAAAAPHAAKSMTLFPIVAEPGGEVPNKRARQDSFAASSSGKHTTQTTSNAATSTTASHTSRDDDSCETPKSGRTNGARPDNAASAASMPLAHQEAAPAQARQEFSCAESPIR
ncbi:hypothetical protein F1559_002085 [Cyanidiococcus yangmingshanensis]|uniref:Uncharacterized protein n=1 Tax=Cyanidiococcus yangmingshanensis TaxID=2690220 RepID=A0A7J7IL38_9RHOD|nr:hypothetical protein F1559_002085 [Cyanidiococcus yangmingshanensis]